MGLSVIPGVLINVNEGGRTRGPAGSSLPLLALKMEEEPRAKGHMWPPEAGNGKGTESLLELPEGTRPHQPFDVSLVRPISECRPLDRKVTQPLCPW